MFEQNTDTIIDTAVLIVGAGIAGMMLAIDLVDKHIPCVLVCKRGLFDSNTAWAQGGVAAVGDAVAISDCVDKHIQDTLIAGAGLCDYESVSLILNNAPTLIHRLTQLGLNFDRRADGSLDLHLEGGHSAPRVLHTKDATGISIARALVSSLKKRLECYPDHLTIIEEAQAEELCQKDGRVNGATFKRDGQRFNVSARFTVLATGGTGALYSRTTNPRGATGDGIALAYQAGATLADLEFTQFHPTALCLPGAPSFLVSEAVRGAGAVLRDASLKPFMKDFHPDADLATRDIVSRSIQQILEEQKTDHVFLDLEPIGRKNIERKFPMIVHALAKYGVNCLQELVPIAPAAHYFMGGILTDATGRTDVPGLYAIGECAASGLHGANRLASNSLLEGGVMALLLGSEIAKTHFDNDTFNEQTQLQLEFNAPSETLELERLQPDTEAQTAAPANSAVSAANRLRTMMYKRAGVLRSRDSLEAVTVYIDSLRNEANNGNRTQLKISSLMTNAALLRQESRGAHNRRDFPFSDDATFAKRLTVKNGEWRWIPLGGSNRNLIARPAWQPALVQGINQVSA